MNKENFVELVEKIDDIGVRLKNVEDLNKLISDHRNSIKETLVQFLEAIDKNYAIQNNTEENLNRFKEIRKLISKSMNEQYDTLIEEQFNYLKLCIDSIIDKIYEMYKESLIEEVSLLSKKNETLISNLKDEINNAIISEKTLKSIDYSNVIIEEYLSELKDQLNNFELTMPEEKKNINHTRIKRIETKIHSILNTLNEINDKI